MSWADIDAVLITHGHMDHFGGLGHVRSQCDAPVGVHALDRRVLSHHEERVIVASKQLRVFLKRCGLSEGKQQQLMHMYMAPKSRYRSLPVEFTLTEGEPVRAPVLERNGEGLEPTGEELDLGVEVFHTPGHCPGQVCIRVDDHLLTADHVLARITPHQAPESITLNMGLEHYFASLDRIAEVQGIQLALGGHEEPMPDLYGRVRDIRLAHDERLAQIRDFCTEPRTTADISRELFGTLSAYQVLLGLEEAGAHVEYLYLHGELVASNLEELEREEDPVVRYIAT